MNIKGIQIALTILPIFFLSGYHAYSQQADLSTEQIIREQIEALPTYDLEKVLRELDPDVQSLIPPFNIKEMVFNPQEGLHFDLKEIISTFGRQLLKEVLISSSLLAQLIILSICCALLNNLASALEYKGVQEAALMVCLLSLLLLSLGAFRSVFALASATVSQMVDLMYGLLPILIVLLASMGGVTSAAILHPLILGTATILATFTRNMVFPLALVGVVLGVAGRFMSSFPFNKLAALIRKGAVTVMGVLFIVFMGVLTVRGAVGPAFDSLGIKTAKFLTGTLVPVVGSRLAEAFDVVVGGSLLIKNAIGLFGMIAVFFIVGFPLIKVFSVWLIFKTVTALAESIVDERLVGAMSVLSEGVALALACMLIAALMLFISITVMVAAGSLTMVMQG
jgi:stage III sporulation protein AE